MDKHCTVIHLTRDMHITIVLPDDLAARLGSTPELQRRALEALLREEHRAGRLAEEEVQDLLAAEILPESRSAEIAPTDDLVAWSRAFRAGKTLGSLRIKDLIEEGRR